MRPVVAPGRPIIAFSLAFAALLVAPQATAGQGAAPDPQSRASSSEQDEAPEGAFDPTQPDFTIAGLQTTLGLPTLGSAFRVTHRFARPVGAVEDLFGIDSGAQIGLEYRIGLVRGSQIGVHRTSNRTIDIFGLYRVRDERRRPSVRLAIFASIEGTNNFRDSYSPAVGAVVSRAIGERGAIHMQPMVVNNSNPLPASVSVADNSTMVVGLAARLLVRPATYLIAEASPRLAGYAPGVTLYSIGVEKQVGGHMFQLNLSNGFGTTPAQIVSGGGSYHDLHLGFSISRKFF